MSITNTNEKIYKSMEAYLDKGKTVHVAVFKKELLKKVLTGEKTIESRFSKKKIDPYDSINDGDVIFLKETSGPIVGKATVKKVKFYSKLDKPKVNILKSLYQKELCADESFWKEKIDSVYATLISLKDIIKIEPFKVQKTDRRPWVILKT